VGRHIADGYLIDMQPKGMWPIGVCFMGVWLRGVWPNISANESADRSVLTERVTKDFDTERGSKRLQTRQG
jgi:hypothetical protein